MNQLSIFKKLISLINIINNPKPIIMKNPLLNAVLVFLLFCYFQTSNGQALSDQQKTLIENQVDSIFQKMIGYAEKLDYDALSAGVDDRYHVGFITNGQYYANYSTLLDAINSNTGSAASQKITLDKKKITALSENIAIITASGTSAILLNDGNEVAVTFDWSFVYFKFEGEWKVIQSHQSRKR